MINEPPMDGQVWECGKDAFYLVDNIRETIGLCRISRWQIDEWHTLDDEYSLDAIANTTYWKLPRFVDLPEDIRKERQGIIPLDEPESESETITETIEI